MHGEIQLGLKFRSAHRTEILLRLHAKFQHGRKRQLTEIPKHNRCAGSRSCFYLSRYKTNFHGTQQAFVIQNGYVEQNSVSRCKVKQKFGRLVTCKGNFISRDNTTTCSLPTCFENTRASQLTMAASLIPTGDEKEKITYFIIRQAPRAGKMNQIPRFDWLPERARWSDTARPGLPVLFPQ